ncbi:hypothetical protein B2D07_18520 [Desulfococcus multivorans]|nr:hypothetical protein B2D07_18520 [Desulfococcus multivorans]
MHWASIFFWLSIEPFCDDLFCNVVSVLSPEKLVELGLIGTLVHVERKLTKVEKESVLLREKSFDDSLGSQINS